LPGKGKPFVSVNEIKQHPNNPLLMRQKMLESYGMQQRFILSIGVMIVIGGSSLRLGLFRSIASTWLICPEFISAFIP